MAQQDRHVDRQNGDQSKADRAIDQQRRSGDHGPLVSGEGQMENINADEDSQGRVDEIGGDSANSEK